jgi:16S rRNA (cytosine1402-N4)-methyltransferase
VHTSGNHTTVLLNEAVDALLAGDAAPAPARGRRFVDATFGRGGHSRLILSRLSPADRLTVFDKDPEAIAAARALGDDRLDIRHEGFCRLGELPAASVDGILMDLGVSSPQIDSPERGFSFRFNGPLDMRMDTTRGQSVADWLAVAPVEDIARVLRDYGEERFAGPVARAIVARREQHGPLATTTELSQLVGTVVRSRDAQNPATRTFQGLRIFINGELDELQQALDASLRVLRPGGRLVVISFHSLEDRIVKTFVNEHSREVYDRRAPFAAPKPMRLQALDRTKPGDEEVRANPRARSAVMRVAVRTAVDAGAAEAGA